MAGCRVKTANEYFEEAERLEEQEKYQEAILLLDKAIQKNPQLLGAYINRGADKSALENYKGAIEDYQKVVSLDSMNTLALFNLGNNFQRLQDYKNSLSYFNKALRSKTEGAITIEYNPNQFIEADSYDVPSHEIFYARAVTYYNLDSMSGALNDFKTCIERGFMMADSYLRIGYVYISTGKKQKACDCFLKSYNLGNKDAKENLIKFCKGLNLIGEN